MEVILQQFAIPVNNGKFQAKSVKFGKVLNNEVFLI